MKPPRSRAVADGDARLAAAGRGDPEACGWLYRRFAGVVHGIALGHVGRQEADDVVQEVFMTVFGRVGSVRDEASLAAWIGRVARNTALDHLRRRRRRPRPRPLHEIDVCRAEGAGDDELAERVLGLLRELPEAYRETLTLRLVEGLSGPEIAERTGMTPGSVRVNLCRGLGMLRPRLEREGW